MGSHLRHRLPDLQGLTLAVELGYIHLSLNDGVWGNVLDNTNRNAYKASVNMRYAF